MDASIKDAIDDFTTFYENESNLDSFLRQRNYTWRIDSHRWWIDGTDLKRLILGQVEQGHKPNDTIVKFAMDKAEESQIDLIDIGG